MADTINLDLDGVIEISRIYGYQYYLVELTREEGENKKIVLVFALEKETFSVKKTFSSELLIKAIKESRNSDLELFRTLGGTKAIIIRRPLKPIIEGVLEMLKKDNNEYTVTKSEPLLVTETEEET